MKSLKQNALILLVVLVVLPISAFAADLHEAVESDNLTRAKKFLKQDPRAIHTRDEAGHTPLQVAIIHQKHDLARWLLDQGADPNAGRDKDVSPMHTATMTRDLKMLVMLVAHGGDINIPGRNGTTPLQQAVDNQNGELVELILDLGAEINLQAGNSRTSLHSAVLRQNVGLVQRLLERGADPNAVDGARQSALHLAVQRSRDSNSKDNDVPLQIVRFLLKHDGDATATDAFGYTPMWHAQRNGHIELLKAMLDHGAEPDIFLAMQLGMSDSLKQFKQQLSQARKSSKLGQLLKRVHVNGDTPLHFAVRIQNVDAVETLLESGAIVNAKTASGVTPLHLAAQTGSVEIAQLLAAAGADVNATSNAGRISQGWGQQFYNGSQTPLHFAATSGKVDTVAYLLSARADANRQDFFGCTPLHLAVIRQDLPIVTQLADHGASLNIPCWNAGGSSRFHFSGGSQPRPLTPLAVAQERKHKAVAEYLAQEGASLEPDRQIEIPTLAAKKLSKLFAE